ncbi:cytochrome d ubiquinol oxidase subunit II [Weissella confusa]|uniref:cytochrome d ubiquinol oxidase subunit II n=1 Tax=Weissella confusa TaxID=1583 RepID=UPI0021AEBA33|nr:cytochrome d ubiquinol oxidase subunit II [Weissella confusa]MCS9989386.1 cytochrome d ubiquinol oxidase subunit II [Weissella confusa]
MTGFQILWFVLIAILFAGFFFLEGFDFGVGMALKGLAKNEHEEDALIESIGPHWDGNEVWLITAGGAMFAAMPFWYASLFSGFYLILFAILIGLIYRGVSFEFREQMRTAKFRNLWTTISAVAALIVPFLFGVLFTDVVQGMPLDKAGDMSATFFDYFNIFSIVGGVAVALLSYIHGLNYLRLKIEEGELHDRIQSQLKVLYPVLLVGEVAFAVTLFIFTDFFAKKPLITLAFLAVIVLLTVIAWVTGLKLSNVWSFIALGLTIISVVLLLFTGLFPRVIVGDSPAMSLLLKNATSTPYTLKWMTMIAFTALPIVLAYQIWSFYIFRKRIVVKKAA